jgi:hypothetical protein
MSALWICQRKKTGNDTAALHRSFPLPSVPNCTACKMARHCALVQIHLCNRSVSLHSAIPGLACVSYLCCDCLAGILKLRLTGTPVSADVFDASAIIRSEDGTPVEGANAQVVECPKKSRGLIQVSEVMFPPIICLLIPNSANFGDSPRLG